jgi:hypothetical protein
MVEKSLKREKMKNAYILLLVLGIAAGTTSCKRDDYFSSRDTHTAKVEMTTYDFLKSHPQGLFDTLLLLIDRAGLKDKINQPNSTFFAPTDYAITNYLNRRVAQEQNIDPFRKWTIDSLIKYELPKFTDSINVYLVNQPLAFDQLTENGIVTPTLKSGANAVTSWEFTNDANLGYNPNAGSFPRIVYYALLLRDVPPPVVSAELTAADATRARVQTAGIQTNTGMVHVLFNGHTLFFRK